MIKAPHPDISGNIKTFLTRRAEAGQKVLNVLSNVGFAQDLYAVIGNVGEEQTEIQLVDTITNKDTITFVGNLNFAHEKNCKVTLIDYNQVKFHKCSTIDGVYTPVSTKDIAIGEPFTSYVDNTAIKTDYFKVTYYNSYADVESGYSDPMPAFGFPNYALAMIVDAFLEEAQDKAEKFYKRSEIIRWVSDCKNDCFNKLADNNENFGIGYHELNLVAGENEVDLPADFKKLKLVQISYDGSTYKNGHHEDLANTTPDRRYEENDPRYYLKGTTKIGIRPTPTVNVTAGIKLWSEDHPADLKDDADELPSPLNRYLDMVMNYLWYRALRKDKKFTESRIYKSEYEGRRAEFIEETNNLVLNENRSITDPEDGEYYDELA